ncbi:MAG: hypothetical protein IKU45_05280, partial [Clostridia bacterium]|nr:hypothetical protein [Clostridia bacterium]
MENKLPERKIIRLKKFDYNSVGAYFITICTQDKKPILSKIVKPDNKLSYNTNDIVVGDGALDVPRVQLTP